MNWITNHPGSLKGMWPRRLGVEYIEGEPKATEKYSAEKLKQEGLIGVYVNIPLQDYYDLPIIKSPKDRLNSI